MQEHVTLMIMSGVDDGSSIMLRADHEGQTTDNQWTLTIGRKDSNDLCLRNDTFVSRYHAALIWHNDSWWLQDKNSTNGTFLENGRDFFSDEPVEATVPIKVGQMFRVGRTWLRIQVV